MWKRPQLLLAAIWQLIRNAGLVDTGDPTGLCFEEVALLVSLDGEHPSSSHIISLLNLPHVNEVKKPHCQLRMCTQDVSLQQTACSIFVVPELMLPSVHEISFLALVPATLPQVTKQRSSMSLG